MRIRLKILAIVLAILLILYTGSYACLSAHGRFEPFVVTMAGVQEYGWAPEGFVHDFKWHPRLMLFYLPILRLDWAFWHKSAQIPDHRYPIDEVKYADTWKLYVAWGLAHEVKSGETH